MNLATKMAVLLSGGQTYAQKVLGTQPASLIAYWPLSETSGTTADNAEGTAARDGTYARNVSTMGTGTGIGDGNTAPLFDGSNDVVDVYSASLDGAFNGAEGTVAAWMRVSGAGVWTDAASRYGLFIGAGAASNYVAVRKSNTDNRIQFYRHGGATLSIVTKNSVSATGWIHLAVTWSESGDAVKAYYNGAQEGATQTGIGTFAGALDSALCVLGSNNNIPTAPWDGYVAHAAVWTTPLSADEIAALASL